MWGNIYQSQFFEGSNITAAYSSIKLLSLMIVRPAKLISKDEVQSTCCKMYLKYSTTTTYSLGISVIEQSKRWMLESSPDLFHVSQKESSGLLISFNSRTDSEREPFQRSWFLNIYCVKSLTFIQWMKVAIKKATQQRDQTLFFQDYESEQASCTFWVPALCELLTHLQLPCDHLGWSGLSGLVLATSRPCFCSPQRNVTPHKVKSQY